MSNQRSARLIAALQDPGFLAAYPGIEDADIDTQEAAANFFTNDRRTTARQTRAAAERAEWLRNNQHRFTEPVQPVPSARLVRALQDHRFTNAYPGIRDVSLEFQEVFALLFTNEPLPQQTARRHRQPQSTELRAIHTDPARNREYLMHRPRFNELGYEAQEVLVQLDRRERQRIELIEQARYRRQNAIDSLIDRSQPQQEFEAMSAETVVEILRGLEDAIFRQGRFFIISASGRFYTLGAENYDDLLRTLLENLVVDEDEEEESDYVIARVIINNRFTISVPRPREQQQRTTRNNRGAYFPYLHNYGCTKLAEILARIGIWSEVDPANYKENCLIRAFADAGVEKKVLQDMKKMCRMRSIPRRCLREISDKYGLHVIIRTRKRNKQGGDIDDTDDETEDEVQKKKNKSDTVKYGPKTGHLVKLGLIQGHFFHIFDTPINTWALLNYEHTRHINEWWKIKCAIPSGGFSKEARGSDSFNVVQRIMEAHRENPQFLTRICVSTHGCFKTQFFDKADREFDTLEYPETAVKPTHNPRHVRNDTETVQKIEALMAGIIDTGDSETVDRLMAKVQRLGICGDEEIALYRKHKTPIARIFFDFETNTDHVSFDSVSETEKNVHEAYLVCWATDTDDQIYSEFDETCGARMLGWILDHYGVKVIRKEKKEKKKKKRKRDQVEDEEVEIEEVQIEEVEEEGGEEGGEEEEEEIPTVVLLAHNVTYDFSFLCESLYSVVLIERGTNIICGSAMYRVKGATASEQGNYLAYEDKVIRIEFRDSNKVISGPLADFSEQFNLPDIKQVIPYDLYTYEFCHRANAFMASEEELRRCNLSEDKYQEMMANLIAWDCVEEGGYNMLKYSRIYCEFDIKLLKGGWQCFRADMLKNCDIDIWYYPTTASIADTYLQEMGCYNDVYTVAGAPRDFIERCNVGGRTMCANNIPFDLSIELQDLDANSLYPSAMVELPGYPKGKPKVWNPTIRLDQCTGYYLEIKVIKIHRTYNFPLTMEREHSNNNWTNAIQGEHIHVDNILLEDLRTHYAAILEPGDVAEPDTGPLACESDNHLPRAKRIQFEIVQGYYFNEGFNPKIGQCMQKLFNLRKALKAAKNPGQLGVKLLMNTGYGKCGQRPFDTEVTYLDNKRAQTAFIHNHHARIKEMTPLSNGRFRITAYKPIDDHFNKQHLSVSVLSMSKRIMNRVMCLADTIGADIYYTDTDSMHITRAHLPKLVAAFRVKYNRELDGKELGQMHSDFEFESCYKTENNQLVKMDAKSVGEIYATRSIFLGKKSYIDRLTDMSGQIAFHIRMKGGPMKCIIQVCNEQFDGNPIKMYEYLYQGGTIVLQLGRNDHVMFKVNRDHTVSCVCLERKVCFKCIREGPEPSDRYVDFDDL